MGHPRERNLKDPKKLHPRPKIVSKAAADPPIPTEQHNKHVVQNPS
jgi:hypothetical protein